MNNWKVLLSPQILLGNHSFVTRGYKTHRLHSYGEEGLPLRLKANGVPAYRRLSEWPGELSHAYQVV